MEESSTSRRLSRRTVAKGAAWTVPAIAVVSPSPAMAASPGIVTFTGQNCKLPGNSTVYTNGAVYLATIANDTNLPITITIDSVIRGGVPRPGSETTVVKLSGNGEACCVDLGNDFVVPANSSGTYALVTQDWDNSANETLTVNFSVDGVPQPPALAQVASLNPFTNNPQCGIGGSCSLLTDAQKQCILKAIGEDACQSPTIGCS